MVFALITAAAAPVRASVRVTLHDGGRIAISATDASVAEILAEWARATNLRIVNADKLPRERLTIELQDVTEREALDVVLRSMGGYIARRRIDAEWIDSVMVVPQSAPIAQPPPAAAANARAGYYAPRVDGGGVDAVEPAAAAGSAEPPAPTFSSSPGYEEPATVYVPPVVTRDEEAAAAVAQAAIRTRRALETVNPRDVVLPKRGGS